MARGKFCPERCYTLWRIIGHVIVLALVLLFWSSVLDGLDIQIGKNQLRLCVMMPMIFAALFSSVRPSLSKWLAFLLFFFLAYMLYFRMKLIRCEHAWKEQCKEVPINVSPVQDNVSMQTRAGDIVAPHQIGCYPGVMGDNVSQRMDLFEYCKHERHVMPKFWMIGSAESHPAWCEIVTPIQPQPYIWCRMECHPFTCMFAKGGSPDFKISAWQLWFAQIMFLLVTVAWWTNCLPLCGLCFWCYEKTDKIPPGLVVDAQHTYDNFTGCGSLPYYMIWFWACWLPLWLAMYVTFVEGGFEAVMPEVKMDWSVLTVLFSDVKNLAISAVVMSFFVVLYIQRTAVFQALGIDDRNILHWRNLFGWSTPSKDTVLQVCVWKVVGSSFADTPREEQTCETIFDRSRDREQKSNVDTMLKFLTCSRRHQSSHPHRPTLELASDSSLFVRIAYGHNEPLNGRVVRVPPSYGQNLTVYFKEVFRLNYQDYSSLADQPALYIELQKQDVYSRQDLGRIKIEPERLRYIIESAEYNKDLAQTQVMAMIGKRSSENSESCALLTDKAMEKDAGFLCEPLAHGGAVWYSIAPIDDDAEA